ncbi:hypothetical protein ACQ4N7_20075 [Nodosilinea sp. AN01ver1]|uniref:hypothetical protein n=1 Tax=Nodosilinea sp. AN01ver1 TaxID=3423362 RepID=UPI003D31E246
MKQAFLVISEDERKVVNADKVDHSDFSQIFQCIRCNATVTLRSGHYRGGSWIAPSFVHPEGDLKECSLRVSIDLKSENKADAFAIIGRGQNNKKLEKAFIDFFKACIRCNPYLKPSFLPNYTFYPEDNGLYRGDALHLKRYINYNKAPGRSHDHPELLLDSCVVILKSLNSQKFFLDSVSELREKLLLEKSLSDQALRVAAAQGVSVEDFIKSHCSRLLGITKYLCKGSSDSLRKQFFEIVIWADRYNLPFPIDLILTQRDKAIGELMSQYPGFRKERSDEELLDSRQKFVQKIKSYDFQMLANIQSNPLYLRDSFSDFYEGVHSSRGEFVSFALQKTFQSIKMYNWLYLPNFYGS